MSEHLDVVIIGAGISGIDAAYRIGERCPDRRFAILEARDAMGGTWDLFRYPGVRSDSDMSTLGFPFRPWRASETIADGAAIRDYVRDTARAHGIDRHVRFGHRVLRCAWSTADASWSLDVSVGDERRTLRCSFLYVCTGYYDYRRAHVPDYPDAARFTGPIVVPQFWPEHLDVAGKRVVVIGSGATAVTLVPALAERGADVTMLQRSPTYLINLPRRDRVAARVRAALPARLADSMLRWRNVLLGALTYSLSRRLPARVRRYLLDAVRRQLGPEHEVDRHFAPSYDPWDQRLCVVPDGDLFRALRDGRARVVTDRIERLTENGIALESGRELPADVIVSATGLVLQLLGGAELRVDGEPVVASDRMVYKGTMLEGVPNLAFSFGYTNASWTLKCDLSARWVCRVLQRMAACGATIAVPRAHEGDVEARPLLDFTSGYVQRADAVLPRQGSRAPWRLHQNYLLDLVALQLGELDDGTLELH